MGETKTSIGSPPRRRIDRETTPGRCGNLDYCSIGMQRVQVRVPISAPFFCPECGGRLRPPGRLGGGPWVMPALRFGVLIACMGASLGAGYGLGRAPAAVHQAAQYADSLRIAPPPATPAPAAKPPIYVAERVFPSHAPPIDTSNPATHLPHEAKFGQVTLDCLLESVLTHPSCSVTDIRGADTFSAAALAWLQGLAIQYAPSSRNGGGTLLDHRWRVVLQDFSGTRDTNLRP